MDEWLVGERVLARLEKVCAGGSAATHSMTVPWLGNSQSVVMCFALLVFLSDLNILLLYLSCKILPSKEIDGLRFSNVRLTYFLMEAFHAFVQVVAIALVLHRNSPSL